MRLIVDQSLAAGFIPINTRQQKAALPFKPGGLVLERKVNNNDGIHSFPYKRLPSPHAIMCCNTLSHSGLPHRKEYFG